MSERMQPTNFLRKAWPELEAFYETYNIRHSPYAGYLAVFSNFLDNAPKSTKFCLPVGGAALPGQTGSKVSKIGFRLPYPSILIECQLGKASVCVLAQELGETSIAVTVARRTRSVWDFMPYMVVLEHNGSGVQVTTRRYATPWQYSSEDNSDKDKEAGNQYSRFVLCMLEALECKNVRVDVLTSGKRKNVNTRALPFDEYRVLSVDITASDISPGGTSHGEGDRRRPREHLRRGTVCRNKHGTTWWKQGTVVNAGVGGKITKGYALCAA